MKNNITLLLCIGILTGCATTQHSYQVKLESDPPGARVFLALGATAKQSAKSQNYLGTTPCVANVEGDRNGYFKLPEIAYVSDYVAGNATFRAEPPSGATNQFTQTVTYRGKSEFVSGDKIPAAVFFDMHKPEK